MSLKTLEYVPGILGVNNSRGGSRTAATSKIELFMIIKKEAVNYYHKVLHLGCCSSPRSVSEQAQKQPCTDFPQNSWPEKFHSEESVYSVFLCLVKLQALARNATKYRIPLQLCFNEFCQIFQTSFIIEHLHTTDSEDINQIDGNDMFFVVIFGIFTVELENI